MLLEPHAQPAINAEKLLALMEAGIVGLPNVGKSTLFNRLTGLRQRIGNYPGVTVERHIGTLKVGDRTLELVDLPGTHALSAHSLEEQIAVEKHCRAEWANIRTARKTLEVKLNKLPLWSGSVEELECLATPALATQTHGQPEGLYVHQIAHLFFIISMGILEFWLRQRNLIKEKGWKYIQLAAVLFILWNIDAIIVHFLDEQIYWWLQ